MNIAEVLKQNKNGKIVKDGRIAEVGTYGYLLWCDSKTKLKVEDLLSQDWELYREKKKGKSKHEYSRSVK